MFETGLDKICNITIGVIADEKTCIERICYRDGVDKEKAKKRLESQYDTNFFKVHCKFCITNEEHTDLDKQINEILENKNLSNENVIHLYNGDLEYLQFRKFLEYSKYINHCFTMKSQDFRALNMEKAKEEYKKICDILNLDYKKIYRPKQTHSCNIKTIKSEEPLIFGEGFQDVDGLITKEKNKILSLTYADCIPLYFYDPVKNIIAEVHSGWRGTYQKIGAIAVKKLKDEFGVNTKDLICCMGPSIRDCCFEVKEDVKNMFYEEFKYTGRIDEIIKCKNSKYYIDTILINKIILKEEGLKEDNIIDSGICTKCNSDKLHSYRVEKEFTGRNTGLIALI